MYICILYHKFVLYKYIIMYICVVILYNFSQTWDNTLELIAQTWVNQCTYGDHDQCRDVG